MIKCDLGIIEIDGKKSVIESEFSTLVFGLKTNNIMTVEEINEAVDEALNTEIKDIMDSNVLKQLDIEIKKHKDILDILLKLKEQTSSNKED